jgi:CrcB protein
MDRGFEFLDPDYEPGPQGHPPTGEPRRAPGQVGRAGRRHDPRALLAVLIGGMLGTLGRYELGLAWAPGPRQFPFALLVINTSGAFLLGVLLSRSPGARLRSPIPRLFLGTGLLGGWTTYSSLVIGAVTLGHHRAVGIGLAFLAANLVLGLLASLAGASLPRLGPPRLASPGSAQGDLP